MAKAKKYRYEVNCKGVGPWYVDLPGKDKADDAHEAYLKHFGIINSDHPVKVSDPQPVKEPEQKTPADKPKADAGTPASASPSEGDKPEAGKTGDKPEA